MSIENTILLNSTTLESPTFIYGEKQKGAGYYRKSTPFHTATFVFDNFKGSVKLQGTLVLYPSEHDWFDIVYDSGTALESLDSTAIVNAATRNFTGNFVWIRAAYQITEGTISLIRYSY